VAVKYLIWGGLIFGLYTGWCWLPAWQTPSQLESGLVNILEHLNHRSPDGVIRERTWKAVDSKGLYVAPKDIHLRRDQRPGERLVEVSFEIPVTVDWLGDQRTLLRPVRVTHRYEVSEAAESARLAKVEEDARLEGERTREAARRHQELTDRLRVECAKGGEDFVETTVFVTYSDGSTDSVPCSLLDES
jgi:hypothetical protein